ncbi:MAG: hypothetical protein J5I90_04400, partial [Caldilineales bacterium]|nr:hypothetical protein [Caldilineales bacterium]
LWAVRPNPSLVLPGFSQPAELTLALFAPVAQELRFELGGEEIAARQLQPGLNTISLQLPPGDDGFPRHLEIVSDQSVDPSTIHLASRAIGSTGSESPANLVLRSAGKDTGDFGHIFVNGVDVSPNQRGYNLAAIDPSTGALIDAAIFDTHAPYLEGESAHLAAWVAAQPEGTIIAGVVRDAAALNLSDEAWQALQSLGVHNDIRGQFRRAHAFVGVKDAPPGSAAGFVSDQWPVTLVIGDGLTEDSPAFALIEMAWSLGQNP